MSVLLEFAMFPTSDDCRDGAGVSEYVSKIIAMIDESGYAYQLTPMGTIVETESLAQALEVVGKAYECVADCARVYSSLKLDIRQGKSNRMREKIASVEKKIGKVSK